MLWKGKPLELRYENKYQISIAQLMLLQDRVGELCALDPHVGKEGYYRIRSLYFDDYACSAFTDNEIGVEPRSKFRIRMYNGNEELLLLEQKCKIGGKIHKESTLIEKRFCLQLMTGDANQIPYPDKDPLINRFLLACHTRLLEPRIIVDYFRYPYVCQDGEVRVTFDCKIACSDHILGFFDSFLPLVPILPSGQELMEVKYTEFLPEFLYKGLNLGKLRQETFSKFYLSEKYRRMEGKLA